LAVVAASLAGLVDEAALDQEVSLGVLARRAENILPDESIEQVLQLASLVGAVDDEAVVLEVKLGLSAELATKVFGRIWTKLKIKYVQD